MFGELEKVVLLPEMRQRLVHIEEKINHLLTRSPDGEFRGSPQQRYGYLTYSQHGEDLVFVALLEHFGIDRPTYLDIGANHPIDCSNTALLYNRGARGVNIDASPDVIATFDRERPGDRNINVGVAGKAGTMTFYRFDTTSGRNSFSREAVDNLIASSPGLQVRDEISVPVMTLDQIIGTYCGGRCPDLVSIDAEGLDYEIVEAASFSTRPAILCIETLSAAGENERLMEALLEKRGFKKCIQMFANSVFVDANARL